MAVPTVAEILANVRKELVIDASTDAPITDADLLIAANNSFQLVWENEGGGLTKVASATAWTTAQSATGVVTGILTDIKEIITLFAGTTSGSTGFSTGDREIDKVEYAQIQKRRKNSGGHGTYLVPQEYSVIRLNTSTPASVGLLQLDYWPSVTGFYFPIHYIRQFVPIDASVVTIPDCSDMGGRDIIFLTAIDLAPRFGRQRFIPTFQKYLSSGMQALIKRKQRALATGDQNA